MSYRLAVLGFVLCCINVPAQTKAGPSTMYSANRLVQECKATIANFDSRRSDLGSDGEHCLGYVQGFIETVTMWKVVNQQSRQAQVPMFRLNLKATNEVIIRKIPIWAIEHPEDTKGSAIEFLISMLVGYYSCPK